MQLVLENCHDAQAELGGEGTWQFTSNARELANLLGQLEGCIQTAWMQL